MNTNGGVDNLIKTADYLSSKSDRWLFIACLLLFLVTCWLVAKYFVRQHESLIADHKAARAEYTARLDGLFLAQTKMTADLMVCLDRNTHALEEHTEVIRYCKEKLKV